ncbi:MAG: hypothetical protein HY900_12980 [Deltaproteobacteria bacterium]|nr:hypothetical protein [Deltaproteobacteria bacterium]
MGFYRGLVALLFLLPVGIMGYKVISLGYPASEFIPAVRYSVSLTMEVDGDGEAVALSIAVPSSDVRQFVGEHHYSSGSFVVDVSSEGENRVATWKADTLWGRQSVGMTFVAEPSRRRYSIPEGLRVLAKQPSFLQPYLVASEGIQVEDPLVEAALRQIFPSGEAGVPQVLRAIHEFVRTRIETVAQPESLDAVTTLKLGQASSTGKTRLFTALARSAHLPARPARGLVLREGARQQFRDWAEVYVGGHWIPFDPVEGWFAELPSNYLKLASGDAALFRYSDGANFQYAYHVTRELTPKRELLEALRSARLNALNLSGALERMHIPMDLIQLLLLFPLGALFITVFRNVVGIHTFGTFLPVLIAAACEQTGLLWGTFGFLTIISGSGLVRHGLDRLGLLHSPKMSIVFTAVIALMMAMMVFGVRWGIFELARMTLFPVAILTVTTERFALIQSEQGFWEAAKTLIGTLVVVVACYGVLTSAFLRSLFVAFPELLLMVVALDLCLGKWVGVRLMELFRFRRLIWQGQEP